MAGRAVDFLIYVNTGTEQIPTYVKVAGQRGGTFNRSKDMLDATSKDSGSMKNNEYGLGEWTIEGDGLLIEDDAGYLALEDAFDLDKKVLVRWSTAAGNKYEGSALINELSNEAPYDDLATYSVSLTGDGDYAKVTTP